MKKIGMIVIFTCMMLCFMGFNCHAETRFKENEKEYRVKGLKYYKEDNISLLDTGGSKVKWSVENKKILEIKQTKNGKNKSIAYLHGLKYGKTYLVAKCKGKVYKKRVVVEGLVMVMPDDKGKLVKCPEYRIEKGYTFTLTQGKYYSDEEYELDGDSVKLSMDDGKNAVFLAKKRGSTVVTMYAVYKKKRNVKGSFILTVY